jgi:multidrug efflux system membrane fusion protein
MDAERTEDRHEKTRGAQLTTESEGLFRPSRRNALIAVAVLLLVGLAAWYFTQGASKSGRSGRRPATTVGIAKAVAADMPVSLTAIGTVQPIVTATVRTQLAGTLFSIHFTEGQIVRKGQLLAEIDPRPYRLALAQAQANMMRDIAQLNLAKVDLNRYRTLLAQDSIARQQVDTQAATAKQLEGTVAADRAAVGSAKLNLAYTAITAPVSGRVGLRQADIGNYLTPGDTNGVAVITETDPIDVSFSLPQNQLPSVQQKLTDGGSMPVVARDQNGTAVIAQGRFLTFDNQIDATSGTVKAKARFGNSAGTLFPNQFVNVSLLIDTVRKAVTVPVGAVRHGAQGDFVFLLQPDKTVKLQLVKTGPGDTARIAILSGVAAGQTVITEGADSLDDGSSVTLAGDKRGGTGGAGGGGKGSHKGGKRHKSGGGDGGGQ